MAKATDGDRLDWIFETPASSELATKYDEWAESYDDDHDEWGWRGPELVAETVVRLNDGAATPPVLLDVGCGTGRLGQAMRAAGWSGTLLGLDLSQGMLDVAARSGVYDALIRGSVFDISLPPGSVSIAAAAGVFTHGHVGGEGFSELCRVTASGGLVAMTQRDDLVATFAPFDDSLTAAGEWQLIERTTPANLHPTRGETMQQVACWRVA